MHIENGQVSPSAFMSESFDLSYNASDDEDSLANEQERRNSLDLDLLQQKDDAKSTDSLMMEVIFNDIYITIFNLLKSKKD